MKLTVIIPVYNEATTVHALLERVLAVPVEKEVLIVDDGSDLATKGILSTVDTTNEVRLFAHPQNRGKGAGIRTALEHATGDVVIIQDADLEYSPEEFPELISLICEGRADVVYGSRFLGRHRVFLFTHYAGNRFLTLVTNVLYNTMLTDMETCYKVMRAEVLRSFQLVSNGFGIEPELTAKIFTSLDGVYQGAVERWAARSSAAAPMLAATGSEVAGHV